MVGRKDRESEGQAPGECKTQEGKERETLRLLNNPLCCQAQCPSTTGSEASRWH